MPKFNVSRHVPYTVDEVYAIASDVASYKTFLPLVKRSIVRNRKDLGQGRESFETELHVAYAKLGIAETLHSRVEVDFPNRIVTAQAIEGPVKHLNAIWRISDEAEGGCTIHFEVDYALKSKTLQFVLSGMFDMIVRRIMTAFEERAKKLYGSRPVSA